MAVFWLTTVRLRQLLISLLTLLKKKIVRLKKILIDCITFIGLRLRKPLCTRMTKARCSGWYLLEIWKTKPSFNWIFISNLFWFSFLKMLLLVFSLLRALPISSYFSPNRRGFSSLIPSPDPSESLLFNINP